MSNTHYYQLIICHFSKNFKSEKSINIIIKIENPDLHFFANFVNLQNNLYQ